MSMVQTIEQFSFIYEAVVAWIAGVGSEEESEEVKESRGVDEELETGDEVHQGKQSLTKPSSAKSHQRKGWACVSTPLARIASTPTGV